MKIFIICIFLLLIDYSFAQHNIFFKAGPSYSWFVNAENSSPIIGYSIGVEKGFHLFKGLFFDVGIGYTTRGVALENRTIQPYQTEGIDINAYYWNLYGKIGYLEFPLHLKYKFPLSKEITIAPIIGITKSFPSKDYSNLKQENFYKTYNSNINDWYDYDYHFQQESTFGNNPERYLYNFGFEVYYMKYSLNLIYNIDDTLYYYLKNLDDIKYRINSITIYCSYQF